MRQRTGSGAVAFVRSVLFVAALVVGVPWVLIAAARARFGGSAPLHGVPSPADWDAGRIRTALTDRLTDQTVADIVIRIALIVAWVAVVVLVVTIIAEVVHMIRHDGLPTPDVRGLGFSQRAARVVASGLLVVIPLFASPSRAIARDGSVLVPEARPAAAGVVDFDASSAAAGVGGVVRSSSATPEAGSTVHDASVTSGGYVVRPGDSIYAIAERIAGPGASEVAAYAEQLVDLNLGTQMSDGQRFTNAAYIDVGWVLQLPAAPVDAAVSSETDAVHVVERGESLWSIADDELGDAERWPEIYEANRGQAFDDGRVLHDPDLIQPGWELDLPVDDVVEPVAARPAPPIPEADPEPARPDNVWIPKTDDGVEAHDLDAAAIGEVGAVGDVGNDVLEANEGFEALEAHESSSAASDPVTAATPADAMAAPGGVGSGDRSAGDTAEQQVADRGDGDESVRLLTASRAAMLSAGVLTLLAVRRRNQLRQARPRARLPEPLAGAAATERSLRAVDPGERFERVEVAIRSAATALVEHDARVLAVSVGTDGELELRSTGDVVLAAPWSGAGDRWHLAAATPVELLLDEARRVGPPCPTLVQLGTDAGGRDVYVDLEALEAIEIGGPGDQADAVVAAVAATLAGSVLAEVTTLIGLGVADEAFLGHRLHRPVRDQHRAFEEAADAVGSTATASASTFQLRAQVTSGETWEPAVVLAGSAAGTISLPPSRTGIAVVSAAPIHGPSSRLAPAGDAWELLPAGIRLVPVGLSPVDIAEIADLVAVAAPPSEPVIAPTPLAEVEVAADDDLTIVPVRDDDAEVAVPAATEQRPAAAPESAAQPTPEPPWSLLVRLLGPVDVVSAAGAPVVFERSKTRELVAWLATHRQRSTRSAARTALWEQDVRDATFANVVSEARRSLARLVEPGEGDEWVGRTMTDALPLHELVVTDADLLEQALDAALLQPPAQAMATLAPAVERITGMPFEGTSYLWPDAEGLTSNLVLLATSAATELAAHCLSVGDIDGVFSATGRGLQVLPGHEELIGLRMQAHARAGDHAGVRQEWESYERVVTADPWSDGEPSPKLVDLRRELLNPSR